MHIVSLKRLRDFWLKHPEAQRPLQVWHTIVERTAFRDFHHIKLVFNSADVVPPYTVFDIGGNKFRLVVIVRYQFGRVFVQEVMTHKEYDRWCERIQRGKA